MITPDGSTDHSTFDSICENVDDYEPLVPSMVGPLKDLSPLDEEERGSSLDDQILARLVTP